MYARKKFFRVLSLVTICAVVLSCAAVSSCGSGLSGKTAMTLTYGNNTTTFSSNIYSYYLSYTKTMMLYNMYMMYQSYGIEVPETQNMTDIPDMWTSEYADGLTYGDIAKEQAENSLKRILAVAAFCKENKLELSKEELNNIDVAMKELINGDKYQRSKAALNSVLIRFNINDEILKEIKKYEALAGVFGTYLFDADTGKRKITNDMITQYYNESCVRVKHILIKYHPGTYDEEGNEEEYPAEELAARKAKVEDFYNQIINGDDSVYESLLAESEDPGTASSPDGYTISEQTSFMPEFIEAAFDMKVGEVRKVETSYGMHIMKKYELLSPDKAIDPINGTTWASAINTEVQTVVTEEELKPYIEKVEINTDETDLFDIQSSDIMFDCAEIMQ